MKQMSVLFWGVMLWVLLVNGFCGVAFALDVLPLTGLPTDDQAGGLAQSLWNLLVTKQYAMAIGPGIALFVWALKKYDTKIPKIGAAIDKFLDQPFVSFLLPTVVSAIGGGVTAFAAGKPAVDVLAAIFQASMSAVFSYVGLKKLGEQREAGQAEAAKVTDKASAIEELKKP